MKHLSKIECTLRLGIAVVSFEKNVSRPHLVGIIERNELSHRKVGSHRRILLKDLVEYQQRSRVERNKALDELATQAQELGLGY